jgi:hypothetical protein
MVEQFKELEARVKSAGNVMDEAGIQKAAEYQRQVTLLGQSWDQLKRTMGEKAIGIIQVQLGGKELSIGGIADLLFTGGAVGAYQDYIAAPKGPLARRTEINPVTGKPYSYVPSLAPGLADPYALMKEQRSEQLDSLAFTAGTPRQQLEAQLKRAEADRQSANSRYIESGNPADLQKYKDLNKEIANLQTRLDGLKKTAVSFAEELARFANRGEPNELAKQLADNREQATRLERQFPGQRSAIESQASRNSYQIVTDSLKKEAEKNSKIELEQTESRLKIEASITEEYEKRLKILSPTLTQSLAAVQLINAPIPQTPAQLARQQSLALQMSQVQESGLMARKRSSGQFTPQQLQQMDLNDSLSYISQQSSIDVKEFSDEAAGFRTQAGNEPDASKALGYLVQAAEADVKAEERKTQANIQAAEAINKFQEAADEASDHMKEEFGNFISGLAAAGREGHAGTYARNFMLGQADKMIGNFAGSVFQPGMFSLPASLGTFTKGSLFAPSPTGASLFNGMKPTGGAPSVGTGDDQVASDVQYFLNGGKSGGGSQSPAITQLNATTDQNTKATVDNTTVMAAVYQALGGDPTSLGLSNLPAMPSLTGGSSTAALPFLGAAGAAGASSAAAIVSTSLKAAGISVPGLTSGGDSLTPSNAVTGLFKMMTGGGSSPTLSTGAGIFGPTDSNGMPIIPGVTSGPATDNWSSMAGDLDQLANGGNGNPGLTSSMSALTKAGTLMNGPLPSDSELANAGSSSSSIFTASNPLTNLFNVNGTASPGQQVGAGLQVGGEAFGAYKGVTQAFKGGAQNIMGGIGETAMSIAPLLGPAAPFVEAGGAVLSLVSSLMGDPRANRQASINHELFNNQYIAPQAINRTMDISGGYAEENFQGNVRGTDLSSLPVLQQAYPDPRHGVIVPGTVLSPFGGGGSPSVTSVGNFGGLTTTSGSGGHTINVTNNVSAIDGDSVAQFFQNNAQALGDGIVHAINTGGSDMANRLRTL